MKELRSKRLKKKKQCKYDGMVRLAHDRLLLAVGCRGDPVSGVATYYPTRLFGGACTRVVQSTKWTLKLAWWINSGSHGIIWDVKLDYPGRFIIQRQRIARLLLVSFPDTVSPPSVQLVLQMHHDDVHETFARDVGKGWKASEWGFEVRKLTPTDNISFKWCLEMFSVPYYVSENKR